jgi:YYY domain-containing protein
VNGHDGMLYLLIWWFVLFFVGLAAFPIAYRFFPNLPDRGYVFAKPLGLLLLVYPFWLLTSFGLLENTFSSIAVTAVVVTGAAWGSAWWLRDLKTLQSWMRGNARHLIVVEAVFALSFFAFAYYRAFNPEITLTEKPMEFMFLNSILKSPQFPPHDAWLSGYAISYYYLGYAIVAMLTRLTSIPSDYTFNLGLTMVYALAATGAFGLGYNIVKTAQAHRSTLFSGDADRRVLWSPYVIGVLGIVFLLVIGNLEAPFESLHNVGFGSDQFYNDLGVNGLAAAPKDGTLVPNDNWWWWRASRVVSDQNPVTGEHIEVIDEFPSFSFLLGDLHPHVLALPFDLVALAVAFNLLLSEKLERGGLFGAVKSWVTPTMLLVALIVGSLGMLNTWDLVTYGFIIIASYSIVIARARRRWARDVWMEAGLFGVLLYLVSYLFYFPFYVGFSSQVQGIMVAVFFKTELQQYLMMFGIFVFVLGSFIGIQVRRAQSSRNPTLGEIAKWALLILFIPVAIAGVGLIVLTRSAQLRSQAAAYLGSSEPDRVMSEALVAYFRTLLNSPGVFILLTLAMATTLTIVRLKVSENTDKAIVVSGLDASSLFALLLAFTGFGLTFGVEFLYVLDTFGSRMNTVFKLYFQAWTLFAAAAAFAVYYLWIRLSGIGRTIWTGSFTVLLALSLVFPVLAYPNRANDFQANASAGIPTLDGTLWIKYANPDDYAGIQWLNTNAQDGAVILEAPGPEYSFYDRVSVATGLETVLGWGGHELQWRGNGEEAAKREGDVEKIYKTLDPNQATVLLRQYKVEYVVVGGLEREKYGLVRPMIDKFGKLGQLVFSHGSMQIYQVNP